MGRIIWAPKPLPNFRLLLEFDKGQPAKDREMRTVATPRDKPQASKDEREFDPGVPAPDRKMSTQERLPDKPVTPKLPGHRHLIGRKFKGEPRIYVIPKERKR